MNYLIKFIWAVSYLFTVLPASEESKQKNDPYLERFSRIYKDGEWGYNQQGVGFSGGGSLKENSEKVLNYLQSFFKKHHIKSVLDIGCGDWELFKHINWNGIDYKGYDIVDFIIEKNKQDYEKNNIHFFHANITAQDFPDADLVICKHVMQHLSNKDVFAILERIKKYKHCIIINQIEEKGITPNENLAFGKDRKLDITQPPFYAGTEVFRYRIKDLGLHQVSYLHYGKKKPSFFDNIKALFTASKKSN